MAIAVDATILGVLLAAAFFDIRERRIPNWLIIVGLSAGLLINVAGLGSGLFNSVLGFFVPVIVLIIPFALGWLGAGDVKLLATVGSILGVRLLPRVFFYSAIAAGIIAICSLLLGRAQNTSFKDLWMDIKLAFLTLGRTLPDSAGARVRSGAYGVPWGVAIGAGTIMAYYFDPKGSWAGF